MIGILVLLVFSLGLLYRFENKSLLVLGFFPDLKRIIQSLSSFLFAIVLCFLSEYVQSLLKDIHWSFNPDVSLQLVLSSFWWDFKSVFTEELLFRGAILYVLIKRIDIQKSILLSAAAFGIYHWFSFGVLGSPLAMVIVFAGTGTMGYAWALAFSKSESILLPLALHLGWNFTLNTIFSKGPLGELVISMSLGNQLTGWLSLLDFLIPMVFVPILMLLYVHHFINRKEKEFTGVRP